MNKDSLNKIVDLLRQANIIEQADDLETLGVHYYSLPKEKRQEICNKIKQMCHPKWLGDLYIKEVTQKEWFGLLDSLRNSL